MAGTCTAGREQQFANPARSPQSTARLQRRQPPDWRRPGAPPSRAPAQEPTAAVLRAAVSAATAAASAASTRVEVACCPAAGREAAAAASAGAAGAPRRARVAAAAAAGCGGGSPADRPARLCSLACIAPLLGAFPRVYGTTRRAAARACAPLQARCLTEALRSAARVLATPTSSSPPGCIALLQTVHPPACTP
jgi:hypothetical protein